MSVQLAPRLHTHLPPLVLQPLPIPELEQPLDDRLAEPLPRNAEALAVLLRAGDDSVRTRSKEIEEERRVEQLSVILYVLEVLLQDKDVELHELAAVVVHGFDAGGAEVQQVGVCQGREASCKQRVLRGGEVGGDFCVVGGEEGGEVLDGGVWVGEGGIEDIGGLDGGVERGEDGEADGEVEGAVDEGGEVLEARNYGVEFAGES